MDAAKGYGRDKHVLRATHSCIFLGVPNRGLNNQQLVELVKGQRNESLVEDLGIGSQRLRSLHTEFCQFFNFRDSRIISIYETKLTRTVEVMILDQHEYSVANWV